SASCSKGRKMILRGTGLMLGTGARNKEEICPCPDGYIAWYLNCYKLVEELATWNDAQDACKKQGGNLASIDMSYDQAFVAGVDGSYSWSDGWPVFFTQWGPGEPTNHRQEGCVSMHASKWFHGTWNDTKCDHAKPYICKISSARD
uniref:C-type lectin domain-containing protein n=1 Tax=Oryzias sinensis TaxID=183150 RepID=A0A8C7XMZ9_9TELE